MSDEQLDGNDTVAARSTRADPEKSSESAEAETDETIYHLTNEPTSAAVIDAVASALSVDPISLDPLYYSVDTDALDALFASGAGADHADVVVSFSYAGCRVTVDGIGTVRVERVDD